MNYDFDEEADAFRVWCEACDFEEIRDEPPSHVVEYWGSESRAREQWSAVSAAKGAADNHRMSAMHGTHTTHIESIE